MGKLISLQAGDGHEFSAYRSAHQGALVGNLVVLQEIFGVNHHIRDVADGFAVDGFDVIAPALFDRIERDVELEYDAEGINYGRELKARLDLDEALLDIEASIQGFTESAKNSLVGYCYGGKLAFAASRLQQLSCCIVYYGAAIPELLGQAVNCPLQFHFGGKDQSIPDTDIETIRQRVPGAEIHIYADADHGFNCDRRAQYHAESSALARQRSLAFIQSCTAGQRS